MNLHKRTLLAIAGLFILVMLPIAVAGCGSTVDDSADASGGTSPSTNGRNLAPDFYINTLDNGMMSLADIRAPGKPIVLNVGASWCDPCKLEAPILAAEYEKYKDRVTFFGFAYKDKEEDQRAFDAQFGLTFPVGLDMSGDNTNNYERAGRVRLSGIPTTYFIDKDGYIVDDYVGPLSEQRFEQKVGEILPPAGASSTPTSTSPAASSQ